MKPIKQAKSYDCYDACVAAIFELPLEDMPGARYVLEEDMRVWGEAWEKFLASLNLYSIYLDFRGMTDQGIEPVLKGYQVAVVKGFRGLNHAIVIKDGEQVWDPTPCDDPPYPKSAWLGVESFQVLDPSRPIGRAGRAE